MRDKWCAKLADDVVTQYFEHTKALFGTPVLFTPPDTQPDDQTRIQRYFGVTTPLP